MDALDRAILSQLEDDGRLSNVELAERVRLSPSATLRRVRNLEETGAITGYRAVIAPDAVGRGYQVTVHATLMLRNRETIEAFEAALGPLEQVIECQRMFGDPDYLIRVAVADAEEYEHFLINTFADLPGLARMTSQFTMKTIKPGGRLPLWRPAPAARQSPGSARSAPPRPRPRPRRCPAGRFPPAASRRSAGRAGPSGAP